MIRTSAIAAAAAISIGATAHAGQGIDIPGALPDGDTCERVWADAESPEMAAAVFVAALITYEFDEAVARDCMTRIVDDGYLANGELSRNFDYLIEVGVDRHAEIARSYVEGATPENGYALPEPPWTIRFERDRRFDLGGGEYRVKVVTSGQGTSRPVTLRRDDAGRYRIAEASTLFVGVHAPQ
ncbi:hypothetical protein DDZ18_05350 [Marinicauda salina]|uniref:DUF6935 domain-containing protein n=1 Tax=Marinicauda salina TaxID=2135793 RepID=A0A2U2BVI4_9PROT|nr:hypothetical protein [Marinicauda salina]PWE18000.1 hypothetical protein DDZ18_05350 [Marinicauda salina]